MRCWRRMEISWTNCVKNDEEPLESSGKEYPTYSTYNETKEDSTGFVTSCIGTVFYVFEGKIEMLRR